MTSPSLPSRGASASLPLGLVLLSLIPVASGVLRLVEVAGGPALMPDNPRIAASPAPVVVHIAASAVYALLGAFQFSARLRRRHRGWHRRAGRVLVVAGSLAALSGLWMTLFYSDAPGGLLLWTVRLLVGSAMAGSIALGFAAIRRRDITSHRAWMIRAYALGLGAGTQAFTEGIGEAVAGGPGDLTKALSLTAGWAINAAVAEWIVRRPHRRSTRSGRRSRPLVAAARS
jgi:uncharacterized membrane protein